jgi:hypothetical protein
MHSVYVRFGRGERRRCTQIKFFHPILFWPRCHVVINKLRPAEAQVACTVSVNVEEKSDEGDSGERRLSG